MPSPDFGMSLMANFHKSPAFFTFSLNSIGDGELRVAAQEMFAAAASGTLKAIIVTPCRWQMRRRPTEDWKRARSSENSSS